MSKTIIVIDMPNSCCDCPCCYVPRCEISEKSLTRDEIYECKPDWCPLNEMKLFNVIGMDDLEGITFARCTTYEKAQKAKELFEAEGFEDMLDIVQDKTPIDVIKINEKLIEL